MLTGFPKNTWFRALHSTTTCINTICRKPVTLTHWSIVTLYTPWNNRKPRGFLVFLGGQKIGKLVGNELKIAYATLRTLGNVLEQLLHNNCKQLFFYWYLTNSQPIIHFYTPSNHQMFSGGYRSETIVENGLNQICTYLHFRWQWIERWFRIDQSQL